MNRASSLAFSERQRRVTVEGFLKAFPIAARDLSYVLASIAAAWFAWLTVEWGFEANVIGFDFRGTLWEPGRAILDGRDPYPAPVLSQLEVGNPAVYPPLMMVAVAGFTALPWGVGVVLWIGLLAFAVLGSLFILGVRDLRCYVLAAVSPVVVYGVVMGNMTLLLVPLLSLAWVWRDRWIRGGLVVALAIAAKLFLWPILLWLVATRRYRASSVAIGGTIAAILLPWSAIGFSGIGAYPELLQAAGEFFAVRSLSIATILSALGADTWFASRSTLALGLAIAALAFAVGRHGRDEESMTLAVLAAVLGSPIVWPFYFALLLVPVAVVRPRFAPVWMLFPVFAFAVSLPRPILDPGELAPGGAACCRPDDVPQAIWVFNHTPSGLWPALACAGLALAIAGIAIAHMRRQLPSNATASHPA